MVKKWGTALVLGLITYFIFSGEFFVSNKGHLFATVAQGFYGVSDEIQRLKDENQQLKLENLNLKSGILKRAQTSSMAAKVYSLYPFINRSEMLIGSGYDDGVRVGNVVVSGNYMIGVVKSAYKGTSVVQTIFDSSFKIPVRVGEKEVDALYLGGLDPRLDLIDDKQEINQGDLIISASKEIPYGLGIGKISAVKGGIVKKAGVEPLFEIKKLRDVSIFAYEPR